MNLGQRGEALIKSYEKLRLKAFKPTPDDPWTIGWGHTHNVKEGDVCTPKQADKWFLEDTAEAIHHVSKMMSVLEIDLTQSMIDALVSLVYNEGPKAIDQSNTIYRALSKEDWFGAWRGFSLWIIEGGKPSLGLARRRGKEMDLFLEDGMNKASQ
jgi:lysozyme